MYKFLFVAILYSIQQAWNFCILGINNNQIFIALGPLGEKFNFFHALGFKTKRNRNHKNSKIQS